MLKIITYIVLGIAGIWILAAFPILIPIAIVGAVLGIAGGIIR